MFRPYRQQALYISSRASLATRRRSIRIVWLGCLAASSSIVARLLRGDAAGRQNTEGDLGLGRALSSRSISLFECSQRVLQRWFVI
jgi:hypothetical protein